MKFIEQVEAKGFRIATNGHLIRVWPDDLMTPNQRKFIETNRYQILDELKARVPNPVRCLDCQYFRAGRCEERVIPPLGAGGWAAQDLHYCWIYAAKVMVTNN